MTSLHLFRRSLLLLLSLELLNACSTAPVSGRSQFILPTIDSKSEIKMGIQAYNDVVKKGRS